MGACARARRSLAAGSIPVIHWGRGRWRFATTRRRGAAEGAGLPSKWLIAIITLPTVRDRRGGGRGVKLGLSSSNTQTGTLLRCR